MEDHYFAFHVRLRQVTHGSKTAKEAHERLIAAGYTYNFEHAEYSEPGRMKEAGK